jgi:TPR repeat protein
MDQSSCELSTEYREGVEIDMKSAVKYYRLSTDQGNSDGKCSYARCLASGKGVEIDMKSAAKYY